jgi:hypothetical protein
MNIFERYLILKEVYDPDIPGKHYYQIRVQQFDLKLNVFGQVEICKIEDEEHQHIFKGAFDQIMIIFYDKTTAEEEFERQKRLFKLKAFR